MLKNPNNAKVYRENSSFLSSDLYFPLFCKAFINCLYGLPNTCNIFLDFTPKLDPK